MTRASPAVAGITVLAATACSGPSAVLDARSEAAHSVAQLWWLMLVLSAAVFLAVMLVLARTLRGPARTQLEPARQRVWLWVTVATASVILTSLFIASERSLSHVHASPRQEDLHVHVTGWQWWWEVQYIVSPRDTITLANELVIPVGRRVRVTATSGDVIHSLWVPNLNGKIDLVAGRTHAMTLTADRPGVSHGPCAEFCGVQHAHMMLLVTALAPGEFDAWLARERLPAAAAGDSLQRAGAAAFVRGQCDYCHRVRGTPSLGRLGPDLTHFAGRRMIAAGTLPNTAANLRAWLADPQRVKPGTRMPTVPLSASDLDALVAYLAALR